ncbi:hypothetical protein [Brassicibacter mesophilus]|uniref:hypothetical protein n=1 Tax=Brassicibacter mesophilus TaxID=745119 RepID=UPI003D1E7C27
MYRYSLLKRVIESNNPYVNKDDLLLLNMTFFTSGSYGEGEEAQAKYDELNNLINETTAV